MPPSDVTQKQYIKTLLMLFNKFNSENVKVITDRIKKLEAPLQTKLYYLNSMIGMHNLNKDVLKMTETTLNYIKSYRDKLREEHDEKIKSNNLTDNQKKVIDGVTLTKLNEGLDELKTKKSNSVKELENYIMLSLMLKYRLRNDLQDIKIAKNKRDCKDYPNCLMFTKDKKAVIYLKEYKTAKSGGMITIPIDDTELVQDIKRLVKNRTFLFETYDGKPLSSSNFTHRLKAITKAITGIGFGSSALRKLYYTETYGDVEKKLEADAVISGHSVSTVKSHYISNQTDAD